MKLAITLFCCQWIEMIPDISISFRWILEKMPWNRTVRAANRRSDSFDYSDFSLNLMQESLVFYKTLSVSGLSFSFRIEPLVAHSSFQSFRTLRYVLKKASFFPKNRHDLRPLLTDLTCILAASEMKTRSMEPSFLFKERACWTSSPRPQTDHWHPTSLLDWTTGRHSYIQDVAHPPARRKGGGD